MATFKEDTTLKYQIIADEDIRETHFKTGDEVKILETWSKWYLIQDDDLHVYNVFKEKIEP